MPTIDADDIAEIMATDEEFNDVAVISSISIGGKFGNVYVETLDTVGTKPMFSCSTAVITAITPPVARGTTAVISGTNYTIENIKNDNTGITALELSEV